MKRRKKSCLENDGKIFSVVNGIFMIVISLLMLYPFYYCMISSVSDNSMLTAFHGILLRPLGKIQFGAYQKAFEHPLVLSGLKNILLILLFALPLNIVMTLICGYFMACKNVLLQKPIVMFVLFTMYFNGGMIPTYLNIRDLGLYNTLAALIIPGCLSVYNAIITRTAIEAIPESLTESARLDGAGELTIIFKIILPLLKPNIAVLLLYYGVGHWNSWFQASIYIKDNDLLPLQNILRSVLIENSQLVENNAVSETGQVSSYTETIKYAIIMISTLPIICIYPFLQKYFTKGVMIGAVKG